MINANKTKPDLIVVLGLKHGPNWGMRRDLITRLKLAGELYRQNPGVKIAVSGRWSIWYDWLGITPPTTEAALMKRYLQNHGVKAADIITETKSKDTIGNAYYLKLKIKNQAEYQKLLIICAEQHRTRVEFIFHKFFGDNYDLSFQTLVAPRFNQNMTGNEAVCLREQTELLSKVRTGHEADFRHQLYNCAYYSHQARQVAAKSPAL